MDMVDMVDMVALIEEEGIEKTPKLTPTKSKFLNNISSAHIMIYPL